MVRLSPSTTQGAGIAGKDAGGVTLYTEYVAGGRQKRSVVIGHSWPPASQESWVEVLVVVDGPMVKYHGKSVRHYVLTLMQIVSMQC